MQQNKLKIFGTEYTVNFDVNKRPVTIVEPYILAFDYAIHGISLYPIIKIIAGKENSTLSHEDTIRDIREIIKQIS